MAEQDQQYDPAAYTVDEVNTYLEGADADERQRVLQAEADRGEDARKGIVEGPHAAPEGEGDPEAQESGLDAQQERIQAQQDRVAETGVLHDAGLLDRDAEDFQGVKPADESAPEGVSTKVTDGFVVARGDDPKAYVHTKGTTMREQKAPTLEGEDYRRGYAGNLPDGERPDLTLQGVLKDQNTTTEES